MLNKQLGLNITHTTASIIDSRKITNAEASFSTFPKENKIDKKFAKKVMSIFREANKNASPIEISCWYAPEFQHFITVPNNKESLEKIRQGEEKSLNCKD